MPSRLIIQSRNSEALCQGKSPPAWWTAAAWRSDFEGMQAQYVHDPPKRSRSTMATLWPPSRASSSAASPAGPRETVAAIVQVGAEEQLERWAPVAEDRAALGGLFAEGLSVSLEGK